MNNKSNKFVGNNAGKGSVDIAKMKQAAESGKLDDYISSNLSKDMTKQLNEILSDKSKTEKLLSSPQAKELMKKLNLD